MAGFAERYREEGMQQGIQQGVEQGRVQGERAVLERLLQRRFGALTPELHQKLEQAATEELERWADKVLDADTLDEIFE